MLAVAGVAPPAIAYSIVGYTPAANNRFASGFPAAPVTNTDPSFTGLPYSWLGVGWASSDPTKGFGFITPKHYLVARHYGGAPTITLLASDGQLITGTQSQVTGDASSFAGDASGLVPTGQILGDLSIGELTASLPTAAGLPRYGVLDANTSSTTDSTYIGQPLLIYGRGPDGTQSPRIGGAHVNGWTASTGGSSLTSNVTTGTLQYGDSGSPDFIPWTNPDGAAELTIIGNNAATDFASVNVFNFLGTAVVMNAVAALTTPDGYALKIVGMPSNVWAGSLSTSIGNPGAWGLTPPFSAPSDTYVLFSGASAGNSRDVAIDTAANLRGLYFQSTGSGTLGFTFSGSSTLTIGRGGITNYDGSRQTFAAAIALSDDQYWNVGSGGVTVAAMSTGTAGALLEVDGSGTARFTGTISGSGGIALTGQRMELTGSNTYSGGTWVHNGTLSAAAGSLAQTEAITVEAGLLSAVNYNESAPLVVAAAGSATISGTVSGGLATVSGFAAIATLSGGHLAIAGGSVSAASGTFGGTITGTAGSLVKTGGGVLSLTSSNGYSGSTVVQEGTLSLAEATALGASAVSVAAGGTLAVAPYLRTTVGGLDPDMGGLVDVGTGGMTVAGGLSVPDLLAALGAGRTDGPWTGTSGITSSAVAAAVALGLVRAVGWLDHGDGSVLFSYAAPSDTNLDGLVDSLDAANFLTSGAYDADRAASWVQGDFNYDGIVDILDAGGFAAAGLFDAGYYNAPPGMARAVVLEPSTWFPLAAACGAGLAIRRRKAGGRFVAGQPRAWRGRHYSSP